MDYPQFVVDVLKRDERFRATPYRDSVGKLTVGYGRNIDDVPFTPDEAEYLLANDIARAATSLDRMLPFWRTLNETRQGVLLNMCFNMGIARLLGFQRMLAATQNSDYTAAAKEMLDSRWREQVGHRAQRLAMEMQTGERHKQLREQT